MKKVLWNIIILLFLTFFDCTEREDDLISQNCDFNCSEIVGKLMTDNGNTPIANHKITVIWDNSRFGSGIVRTKATTRTNSEGEFYLKFFIRDDELEDGYHSMFYDKLDDKKYLRAELRGIYIYELKRDTMLIKNHNVIKKAYVDLTLLNLDDFEAGDYFNTHFSYIRPTGFSQSIDGDIRGWTNEFESNQSFEIAGNQPISLEIVRDRDGVRTREYDTLFVEAGTTINYNIDFNN